MKGNRKPTLLVLRHHGLGDLVIAQPALHGLRRSFPSHEVVVTCPSWLLDLAEFFGTAHRWISEKPGRSGSGLPHGDPCNHQEVDAALLASVAEKIPHADVLVSLRTPGAELVSLFERMKPRLFVSYRYPALVATEVYPELDFSDHILTRWARLLQTIGVDLDNNDLYAEMSPPRPFLGYTVVHVGAGSPSRVWPQSRWVEVICFLQEHGHRVVLTGSKDEAPRVAQVREAANLPASRDRSGDTGVMDLARLVAGARLVLCGDTGISHLATAFRRPAITLFGPVSPAWWGPPPGNPQHQTLWRGKFGNNYASAPDLGLMEISTDEVISAIRAFHEGDSDTRLPCVRPF